MEFICFVIVLVLEVQYMYMYVCICMYVWGDESGLTTIFAYAGTCSEAKYRIVQIRIFINIYSILSKDRIVQIRVSIN